MKKIIQLLCTAYLKIVFVVFIFCCGKSYAAIRYVKTGSAGTAPYTSWATASNDLQAVINQCVAGDDIWVAAGTYVPNRRADAIGTITVNDRDNAFVLKNGVRIFGGFIGTETATSQRNFATNICILSGDLGTAGNTTDNCYHVLVCAGTVSGTTLNGFFIRYGNANGSGNITVNAVSMGRGSGAGMRINSSSPTISNCVFSANTTTNNGGGMVCDNSSPAITNCVFSGNRANDGGAMLNTNSSVPEITNCTFAGNIASVTGGAIRNGSSSSPLISNCIIWNNWVGFAADAIYNADAGSVPVVNYCVVQGGYAGTANINTDPLFINALAPSFAPTVVGDYRVQKCSPCINTGNNSYVPGSINNDLDYTPRINYGVVDIGAYEKQLVLAVPDAAGIVYVDYTKTGDGSSWSNAVAELADAMVAAKFDTGILQIWVAKGTYYPKYTSLYRPLGCNSSNAFNSFVFTDNLKVYGGFAGGETDTAGRNFITNETILNGDIGVVGTKTDNCVRIVTNTNTAGNTALNGFTVINGYGPGSAMVNDNAAVFIKYCRFVNNESTSNGGALLNINSGAVAQITQCDFTGNKATVDGGAIYNHLGASLKVTNCNFAGNNSVQQGGGIANDYPSTSIEIANCSFTGNTSGNGSGVHIITGASVSITGCTFKGNHSVNLGGALCCHRSLQISNCLFSGNMADNQGGAIHFDGGSYTVSNCTIAGNNAGDFASAILTSSGTCTINNSIVYGNNMAGPPWLFAGGYTISNSVIEGGYAGTGNISSNPLFITQIPALSAPNSAGDYHLQKCSPAINAGSNALIPSGITKDLDSNNRIAFGIVDMGAYEKHLIKPGTNGIVYVDSSNVAGAGDGSTWATAITELADALKEAKTNTDIKEIWVAKGTYKPIYDAADAFLNSICHTTDRDASFVLVPDVKLFGGFAGGETDTTGRDFLINETILSGDFNNNDIITGTGASLSLTNNSENAYHIVVSAGAIGAAELNGFKLTRGNASGVAGSVTVNSLSIARNAGGSLICAQSSPLIKNCSIWANNAFYAGGVSNTNSSPSLSNCTIFENRGNESGGMRNDNSSPTIANCTFSGNAGTNNGGGMTNLALSSPIISGCTFIGNAIPSGNPGGGMYNFNATPTISNCIFSNNIGWGGGMNNNAASPIISNCTFSGNTSGSHGGAISNNNSFAVITSCAFLGNSSLAGGGGIGNSGSSPAIRNCIFSGNSAAQNGGAVISFSATPTTPLFANCSFSGNKATLDGGAIYSNNNASPIIKNSILWGNIASSGNAIFPLTGLPDVSNSIIEGGYASGTNILDIDPLFINPQPASSAPTSIGDYHLQACSPALNLGDNSLIPPGLTKDLDSLDRIKYSTVDMGAYEMQTIDLVNTTWKGVNTNWNDKLNWCGGYIPADTTNVTVPLTVNNPMIGAGFTNEVKNISLANNTSLGVANTSSFTINGTYTNLGSTITNNGDWVMAGSAASQTFPGTLATVSTMNNLEIDNSSGIKFDKSFVLTGTLTPTAGNINVDNATVTLNSDATSTARVAAVPATVGFSYTGTGKFEIERYIPPHRAWRLLTAPLSTATNLTISQAWQEGVSNANRLSPVDPSPGFGTTITKSTTYNAADGYDQGSTNNPSIRYYNGTNWGGVPSQTNGTTPGANNGLINDKQGYMLFVRGDRSIQVAGTGVTATATTLRPKGQLKTGPQTINCSGWTVVGNPYASPINFHRIVEDNPGLPDVFYVWDANLAGSSNVGGWVTYASYNPGTQTYTVSPLLSGSTFANNKGDISSGSAFMVNYTGTITINENHKSTIGDNVLYRPVRQFSMNLYTINADSSQSLNDGLVIRMEASARAASAEKNTNFTENLAVSFEGKRYAIQNRPAPRFNDTVFIYTGQMKQRNYILEIKADGLAMPNRMKAYLEDTYLHYCQPVALEGVTRYAFEVNADSASFSAQRFRLLFKKQARFAHIHAAAAKTGIELQWTMEENSDISHYEIEHSANGTEFTLVKNLPAKRQEHLQNQWLDISPATGANYYRIKAVSSSGEVLYSDIAKASIIKNNAGMCVYPNPVTGKTLHLRMNNQPEGQYNAAFIHGNGQIIFMQQWQQSSGTVTKTFELPAVVAAGIYQLEVTNPTGKKEVLAVEVQP